MKNILTFKKGVILLKVHISSSFWNPIMLQNLICLLCLYDVLCINFSCFDGNVNYSIQMHFLTLEKCLLNDT